MTLPPPRTEEAFGLLRKILDDLRAVIDADAETELEWLDGIRVLGRITALCLELNLDVDPEAPRFFSMDTPARFVGGPNPEGEYYLAMIDGARTYRVSGRRGTTAYLGFQVLAGRGLAPRRMAAYRSDRELGLEPGTRFSLVVGPEAARAELREGEPFISVPDDASAVVVREYIGDREREHPAELRIEPTEAPPSPGTTDDGVAQRITAAAWTIAKLATLHRAILPELLTEPNRFVTAKPEELGGENTTPDNLYMIGSFRLEEDEALVVELEPPRTRYWSFVLENVWHECIEPRRRKSSITHARARARPDGRVRLVIARRDPGCPNWLDPGGRHRGFMTFRWLDHPAPPPVSVRRLPLSEVRP